MLRATVLGGLIGLLGVATGTAAADEGHAERSTTLYLASTWSPGPTVPIRIGAEGAIRMHRKHLALEGRLGLGGSGSVTAFSSVFAGHVGGSIGVALPAGRHVVFSPMASYDAFFVWEEHGTNFRVDYLTVAIPVAFVIDPRVVLEPFVQAGIARYHGATDPVIVVGPRIGIVF